MEGFLAFGATLGLVIGLLHSAYLYRVVVAGAGPDSPGARLKALNFCLWACALWFLLGGYLLAYALLALTGFLAFRSIRA
jgi:hypothetical protein